MDHHRLMDQTTFESHEWNSPSNGVRLLSPSIGTKQMLRLPNGTTPRWGEIQGTTGAKWTTDWFCKSSLQLPCRRNEECWLGDSSWPKWCQNAVVVVKVGWMYFGDHFQTTRWGVRQGMPCIVKAKQWSGSVGCRSLFWSLLPWHEVPLRSLHYAWWEHHCYD